MTLVHLQCSVRYAHDSPPTTVRAPCARYEEQDGFSSPHNGLDEKRTGIIFGIRMTMINERGAILISVFLRNFDAGRGCGGAEVQGC
jgi:hypothetical protein